MVNVETAPTGCTVNRNEVTIPKLPPPPPRLAHRRSGCSLPLTSSTFPSAVTVRSARRLSHVSPNARDVKPWPPPSVSPAIPTRSEEHTSELQSLRHLVCR